MTMIILPVLRHPPSIVRKEMTISMRMLPPTIMKPTTMMIIMMEVTIQVMTKMKIPKREDQCPTIIISILQLIKPTMCKY